MIDEAVFQRAGDAFIPSVHAPGPWGADKLHGGPVLGLLARAIELASPDPELVIARFTVDLFRVVPKERLQVRSEVVRRGSRLSLLQASLFVGETEVARANALLLRPSELGSTQRSALCPVGPDGLVTESLMRGFPRDHAEFPPGFHTRVETRWVPRAASEPLAIWFRLPIPLVAGEPGTPLQRAIALSDFANAVASIAARERDETAVPYINADSTLYLSRQPIGEWFCLQEQGCDSERGISVTQTLLCDTGGPFGRAQQARLANQYRG
jgi:hypothetical protein